MQTVAFLDSVTDNEIITYIDKRLYSKSIILKCLYWHGSQFQTSLAIVDSNTYRVSLKLIVDTEDKKIDLNSHLLKLKRDLVDFQLREIVVKETTNVRDLLIAKAFAHAHATEEPPGEIADPVGLINE